MPSSLYELKEILLTYQKLIEESLQCKQVVSESSSTNQDPDSISPTPSVANSADKAHQDWLDFYDFLKQNDIIKENTYGKEFPQSSDYIRYRNSGESGSSGCIFNFIFGSKNVHCEYSRANKGSLFNKYFTRQKNEKEGLALGMFCLNKMKGRFPEVITCNAIEIDKKQIPLCASIDDAYEILHPTGIFSKIGDEKEKFLFTDFLENKCGWHVLMDERLTQKEKTEIYEKAEKYEENQETAGDLSLAIFKIIQKSIVSELEETPLGVYFLDKLIESKKNNSLDVQVIRFIQGIVTIYIDLERSTEEADYIKIGTVDGIQVKLRYRVQVAPSIFKAIANTCFEKINRISDNVSKTPFSQEDYIRVLYCTSRCCRENAGHFASAYHIRKKISELFPDIYTEEEKTEILDALCNEFLSREGAIFRFKNKAYRLFIDGLGTAKYTKENLLSFISAQHAIDRKNDKVPANESWLPFTKKDCIRVLYSVATCFRENAEHFAYADHVRKKITEQFPNSYTEREKAEILRALCNEFLTMEKPTYRPKNEEHSLLIDELGKVKTTEENLFPFLSTQHEIGRRIDKISASVSGLPFTKKDCIRVLYSVATCFRENAGHFVSEDHFRKKITEQFPNSYTEREKAEILRALCNEFLTMENSIYRLKNEEDSPLIDELGKVKTTEENLLSFLSTQHKTDREIDKIPANESWLPFAKEDCIRVLYSVATCFCENAGHFASEDHVRKKISDLFPDFYTEREKAEILKALCNEFLTMEKPTYHPKNEEYSLLIDELGSVKNTEETLLPFLSTQHEIGRKIDNVSAHVDSSSNMQFDHINELRYETLMVYAAAFVENTKERDRVLKQLLNVIDDFDVRERRIQASVVHTLSYILLDCDYLIPNSLRERIFQSTFGKNAYPLQKKIGRHLLKKEYYKTIYEKSITEALEKTEDAKYAKRDSLFFLHVHLDALPQDVDRNCKTAVDAYKQAVELFDSFWDTRRVRITRSEYKEVIEQIKNFVKGTMKDSSETLPVLENLLEIHIAEYLLYSFADVCRKWEIQNNDGLIEVQKLAVIVDYSKKKKCYSYNHEDWQSGMYMTCGSARALAAIAHQKIQQNEKFNLSDEVKNDWKRWLRKELTVAYESTGSLRYTLFMIRLLSLTNINVEEIEDIIWNPDNILYSSTSAEEKAFKKGKQAFQQCFETTCFLEYDAFPTDYNSICNLLGLNRLKNTK